MVARSPAGAVRACIGAGAVGAGPNTVTSGSASGQLEAGDPGLPTVSEWRGRRALHRVVLVDVPERAVINRVHGQVGVAPQREFTCVWAAVPLMAVPSLSVICPSGSPASRPV